MDSPEWIREAIFFENTCHELDIRIVDLDSVYPRVYCKDKTVEMDYLPPHLFWKNSYNAGIASVELAIPSLPSDPSTNVCILGSGSVSQGAFFKMSQLGYKPRLFYRKTLHIFRSLVDTYDVIINGIEVDTPNLKIIDKETLLRTKASVLLIDAAADAGNAIEGTQYQPVHRPFSSVLGRKYLLVNNAPSAISEVASKDISSALCDRIFPFMLRNKEKWLF